MDDTIALVVRISKHQYEICKQALKDGRSRPFTECEFAIAVGVPLDKLREEVMEYIDDLDIAYEICGVFDNIGKAESKIHCNCTDEEIAKSFIEDVEAVKDLLWAESEDKE